MNSITFDGPRPLSARETSRAGMPLLPGMSVRAGEVRRGTDEEAMA